MLKNLFDNEFFSYIEKNNFSKEDLLKLIYAFSLKRKKINFLEQRKKRHKRILDGLDFRKRLLLSDLDISFLLLEEIKNKILRK